MKNNKKKINIIKGINKIFEIILRFIDKYIVTPLTKLVLFISDKTGNKTKNVEKALLRPNILIIVSLLLSIIIFFVVDGRVTTFVESSAEVLYNQTVDVIYNEEAYVVEGIPETVDVTLIGNRSDLYLAKQLPIHEITLDLTGLKPGTHKVSIKYKQSVASIDYKMDPSTATVIIYTKESEVRNLTVDLLNQEDLDEKLVIDSAVIDRDEVIIKGAAHTLEKVATVKALIDVNNIIEPNEGQETLTNIPLIAYDEEGNTINCEIVPSKVSATITISSPKKTVPIKVIPKGTVSFGKAIDSIITDETEVTIYGEVGLLEDITYIPIEIDVEGLTESKEYNVSIEKPTGVKTMSVVNATVKINLGEQATSELTGLQLTTQGLGDNLKVLAASEGDSKVDVILKGTENVLNSLDTTTVRAYIDLTGLGEGSHEVEVQVTGEDLRIEYVPKVKKVTVNIKKK